MTVKHLLIVALLLSVIVNAQDSIYIKHYPECQKIVEGMTLEQKIGQTLQVDFEAITNSEKKQTDPETALDWSLGALLISGNAAPTEDGNLASIPSII